MFKSKDKDLIPRFERRTSFLTSPDGGWLHDEFALSYGNGVYYRLLSNSLLVMYYSCLFSFLCCFCFFFSSVVDDDDAVVVVSVACYGFY
jgi:hypothetical protein